MEQFIVPQFIDVEDKILGPITTRQFVMMIGGGLFLTLAYALFDLPLFILLFIIVAGLVALFGFYKVNGRPFHIFVASFLQVGTKPRLRVWNKADDASGLSDSSPEPIRDMPVIPHKRMTRTRLTELALMVDTGGIYQADDSLEAPSLN